MSSAHQNIFDEDIELLRTKSHQNTSAKTRQKKEEKFSEPENSWDKIEYPPSKVWSKVSSCVCTYLF